MDIGAFLSTIRGSSGRDWGQKFRDPDWNRQARAARQRGP